MKDKRVRTILIIATITLFVSALFLADMVTSASAVHEGAEPRNPSKATESFTINFGINPVGSGQINVDGDLYPATAPSLVFDTAKSLTPSYDDDYWQFTRWTGTIVSTTVPLILQPIQDYNVTANFSRRCFDLTLDVSGVLPGDPKILPEVTSGTSEFCDPGQYAFLESINLKAADIPGYDLVGWSFAPDNPSDEISTEMPAADLTITANYKLICHKLTTNVLPLGTGSVTKIPGPNPECPQNGADYYRPNTNVSLTANPALGYEFLSWAGDTAGSTNTANINVKMTMDRNITANFKKACHSLSLTHTPANNESGGDPTASPPWSFPECNVIGDYVAGENINLAASPNTGWQVEGWINTENDESTSETNTLEFPALDAEADPYVVTVKYVEQPTLQFKRNGYRVEESVGKLTVVVERTGSMAEEVSVSYETEDGTAKSGQDYFSENGKLDFDNPEVNELSFTVRIKDDNTPGEGDENFTIRLYDPKDALLGSPSEIDVIIADDEGDPTVNFSDLEYESPEATTPATIMVTLFPASTEVVSVKFDVMDGGTATNGADYTWREETDLIFLPGETSKEINIPVLDDNLDEPDETVLLELPFVGGAEAGTTEALLRILDDDDPPDVYFEETNYYAREGDLMAPVTVTLSAASGLPITIDYEAIQLTVGRQFADAITFDPGETKKMIEIPLDDYEADDQLEIVLDKAVNATLINPSSATLKIFDKDRSDCYELLLQSNGFGPAPETTNMDQSEGCPLGHFVRGERIEVQVETEPGWVISGWQGTENDTVTSNENVVIMPERDHTVSVFLFTYSFLSVSTFDYVDYFEGPDEVEPNNALSVMQANGPIRSGKQYFGSFSSAGDPYDIFYFVLADTGSVQIRLTDIPVDRDYNLYLYTPDVVRKGYSGSLDNNDEFISLSNLEKGVYFITIHFADGPPSSSKYKMTATYN